MLSRHVAALFRWGTNATRDQAFSDAAPSRAPLHSLRRSDREGSATGSSGGMARPLTQSSWPSISQNLTDTT